MTLTIAGASCAGASSATEVSFKDTVAASTGPKKRRYVSPPGFEIYRWGTLLSAFDARLSPDPLYAQIAYSQGKVTDLDLQCALDEPADRLRPGSDTSHLS